MPDYTTKIISELDFENIRSAISAYIANNTNFTDYNFEGSGLSQLMNILAYNTHYNSVYLNMALNECFLDTAQLRSSVVSLAKNLGYTTKSKKSSISELSFTITETNNLIPLNNTIFLEQDHKFVAEKDGTTYIFSPIERASASLDSNGLYVFDSVQVREGSKISISYTADGTTTQKFLIDNFNIDTESIEISVQNSATDTYQTKFELISDIKSLDSTSTIFYLFETTDRKWQITFGDGILGKKLVSGNIVRITYQTSRGSESNNCKSFSFASTIDSRFTNTNIIFTNIVPSYGGSEEEDINAIRYNAVNNFKTQGRAVTADDYKFLINRDYPLANSISVWGGQDEKPYPKYGKVFISFKPKNTFFLTNAEKQTILDTIIKDKNLLSVIPEIIDPTYTFIQVDSIVKYNPNSTLLRAADIKLLVLNRILEYNDTELTTFGTQFNYSKFVTYINGTDTSVYGNITRVSLRKNIDDISLNESKKYTVDFQNPIHPESVTTKFPFKCTSDPRFGYTDSELYLEDDGLGTLRIYRYSGTDQLTKIYLNNEAGTVDYETGIVILTNFNPSSVNTDGTLDIICKPSDYSIGDISSERNNILTIISSDITIDVRTE